MIWRFFKGQPSTNVVLTRNGAVLREGRGLNFWYMPLTSTIAVVPVASIDAPFIFTLPTSDFQEVTIQGSLTYRILEPSKLAQLLDYTINPANGAYRSEDPGKLVARVVNAVQVEARAVFASVPLRQALTKVRDMTSSVMATVQNQPELSVLGLMVESLHATSIRATPEMQKALEADYREALQREADQAIYARRAAAIAEERKIQETELATEIEIEHRREELVDTQARNKLTLAEADAKAEEMKLTSYGKMPTQTLVGLALKEWAANSGSIDNLSITPDMLTNLVGWLANSKPTATASVPNAKE